MTVICTVQSPFGALGITAEDECVTEVDLFPPSQPAAVVKSCATVASQISEQFVEYFANPAYRFDLDYQLRGSGFQQKVWQMMLNIPPGKVMTYGEIARKLKTSPRAVGNACRANPLPVLVPCHRVVSQAGLGGYGGETSGKHLAIKRWLLSHEGAVVKGL